jgi:hypothetical protein
MIIHAILSAINYFLKYRNGQIQGDGDMALARKRQLLHKDMPDVFVVQRLTGARFDKLHQIFKRFDPIQTETLADNPDKYLYLTKTVIYRLPRQKTKEAVADLLTVEFSLWFKHAYNSYKKKDALADEVFNFKKINFLTDPFQTKADA